jgi:Asp-tRNA(Asn)/Glu-tRNA(Gln) amidotransferase A subunit family amidase
MVVDEAPTFFPHAPVPEGDAGKAHQATPVSTEAFERKGFLFRTARDYETAYREGVITPEEVAARALDAMKESEGRDPAMRIFIAADKDAVMEGAKAATRRIKEGASRGVFDGVPLAVKDELDMVPYPTTSGTKFMGRRAAGEDATIVARMRAQGALLLGKTNMHEFGISTSGLNPHHGTPRNPYNTSRYTGGSSSGSGAAVAAGFCPVAIGADGGGSIRIPSSFCGVVGLKPTFGRVSEYGGTPICWSVSQYGPIAATAEDAALTYAAMAGADAKNPLTQNQPPVTLDGFERTELGDLTLGIYRPWFEHASPSIVEACYQLVEKLKSCGARVREIEIKELDAIRVAHSMTILSEMATSMERYGKERLGDLDLNTRVLLAMGRAFTGRDYIQAGCIRTRAISSFQSALGEVDAIVTPATAITAPKILADALVNGESDASTTIETMRYTFCSNLTGYPAISFPAGYDENGMPIGCQAIGRPWEEHVLLRLAHTADGLVERRRPQIYYDLLSV